MSEHQRILIVDDEPDVCFIIKSLLESFGFQTEVSGTYEECIRKFNEFEPEVVVLDIDLPDGSGLDALRHIKSKNPETRVIMNSALDTSENKAMAAERGADSFIGKPLNRKKIIEAIQEL